MFRRQMLIEVDRPVDSASLNYAVEQVVADARQQGVSDSDIQSTLDAYSDAIACDDLDVEPIDGTESTTN